MARFASQKRVPVQVDDSGDIIYIRAEMDYGTQTRIQGEAVKLAGGKRGLEDVEVDLAGWQRAMLVCFIVGWEGENYIEDGVLQPGFSRTPVTEENILRLNPNDPLVAKVLEEIGQRNRGASEEGSDPKPATNNGEPTMLAPAASLPRSNTASNSP